MNRAAPLACLLLAFSPLAMAQQDGAPPAGGHQPRPEAYAACEGQQAGAKVSLTLRNGRTVDAICETAGDRLAARPLQRPGGGQPPAESSSGA